ncbi:MAG: hypothetical protein LUD17_10855 [Bacteroidales bacterium]|nr:hypothetical protein [Bacteroidales bacterium]
MKKTLLLIAAATLGSMFASAQDYLLNNPNNKAYFGLRASVDISCPYSKPGDMYKNGAGFSIAGIYNTPITANFYFEPQLQLYYNTWGAKSNNFQLYEDWDMTDISFRNFGLAIPLNFGYHFDFTQDTKLMAFTGPMLRIGFVNDMHFKGYGYGAEAGYEIKDYQGMYDDNGLFNRADCAWNFGVGLTIQNYYIGVSGSVGMVNLYNDLPDGYKFRQNTVEFTLGYNF